MRHNRIVGSGELAATTKTGATLYYRYRRCDKRITPGRWWDVMLWISAFGLLLAGGWMALIKIFPGLEEVGVR